MVTTGWCYRRLVGRSQGCYSTSYNTQGRPCNEEGPSHTALGVSLRNPGAGGKRASFKSELLSYERVYLLSDLGKLGV